MKNWGKSRTGKNQHPHKKVQVGLDPVHPQKINQQCHQACTEVEPTGKEEPRPSQEQLKENPGRWGKKGRLHLEADREVSPKQNGMADSFNGPLLHKVWKGISQVSQKARSCHWINVGSWHLHSIFQTCYFHRKHFIESLDHIYRNEHKQQSICYGKLQGCQTTHGEQTDPWALWY